MAKMNIPSVSRLVGSSERVFVAHVNDLNDFYLYSAWTSGKLGEFGQQLTETYSTSLTTSFTINETLNVGDYCAYPSSGNKDWYRGLIRELHSNGDAIVFKIDYGVVQCIPVQFLRPLEKSMFEVPRLAIHCSLANLIKPINGWSSEAINRFCSRLKKAFLYAKFINYNETTGISEVEITGKESKIPLNKDFEQYQIERSTLQMNDKHAYDRIPMEILDSNQSYQIDLLHYINPSSFYVYLRKKNSAHDSLQINLQKAAENFLPISSPVKYQPVAAQDNLGLWLRAVVLDFANNSSQIRVFFIDVGQTELISINSIRQLPDEFLRVPAFAIPCQLLNLCPINGNEQSTWKSDDQVHDEFKRLMAGDVICKVRPKQNSVCYDVQINISHIGDLGEFLINNNLVSSTTMSYSQRSNFNSGQLPQQSFVQAQLVSSGTSSSRQQQQIPTLQHDYYDNSNNMAQQSQTRILSTGLQHASVQQSLSTVTTTGSSSTVPTIPCDGYYFITHIYSAAEFYGLSQHREREFEDVSKHLEDYYKFINEQSLSVTAIWENMLCVIQRAGKYYRVMIKRYYESKSRVLVKLIDRGDEIIVDTSELLQMNNEFSAIPPFVEPFYLHGYTEAEDPTNTITTHKLKQLTLKKPVFIAIQTKTINDFYSVVIT